MWLIITPSHLCDDVVGNSTTALSLVLCRLGLKALSRLSRAQAAKAMTKVSQGLGPGLWFWEASGHGFRPWCIYGCIFTIGVLKKNFNCAILLISANISENFNQRQVNDGNGTCYAHFWNCWQWFPACQFTAYHMNKAVAWAQGLGWLGLLAAWGSGLDFIKPCTGQAKPAQHYLSRSPHHHSPHCFQAECTNLGSSSAARHSTPPQQPQPQPCNRTNDEPLNSPCHQSPNMRSPCRPGSPSTHPTRTGCIASHPILAPPLVEGCGHPATSSRTVGSR